MKIHTFEDLFHDELFDMYNAEKQISKALPKMAEAATDPKLAEGFKTLLHETEGQIKRLEECFAILGIKCEKEKCEATAGILKEGEELMNHTPEGPIRDAAMIAAAQKIEHYEMATYGTLCYWARQLGNTKVEALLRASYDEEQAADKKLSAMAEGGVNDEACRCKAAA